MVVSNCKGKHLMKIAEVFKLDKKEIVEILVPIVMVNFLVIFFNIFYF